MEQLPLVILIIGFIFLGEKSGKGIYSIVAGAISLVMAFTFFQEPLLAVIFIGLAGVLFVTTLFKKE